MEEMEARLKDLADQLEKEQQSSQILKNQVSNISGVCFYKCVRTMDKQRCLELRSINVCINTNGAMIKCQGVILVKCLDFVGLNELIHECK